MMDITIAQHATSAAAPAESLKQLGFAPRSVFEVLKTLLGRALPLAGADELPSFASDAEADAYYEQLVTWI
jgi:hypothetical protein